MDTEPFESISLAPTVALLVHESSDDGLDPNDYLDIQEGRPWREESQWDKSDSDKTPTASAVLELGELTEASNFLVDLQQNSRGSPLQYLQRQRNAIEQDMLRQIEFHHSMLEEGDEMTESRSILALLFQKLSENDLLLHELYGKELALTKSLLASFAKWDEKREHALSRIRAIKSEDNEFGAKLASLIGRRNGIDAEVRELEGRIEALKKSRVAVELEIRDTSSVLESKSAKYVTMFKELERQGKAAIEEYTNIDSMQSTNANFLLKTVPVDVTFSKKAERQSEPLPVTKSNDPYEKGFATGTKQVHSVKVTLLALFGAILPQETGIDDSENTVSEKIDMAPLREFLTSKMTALEDLMLKSSQLSAALHDCHVAWTDLAQTLNARDSQLLRLLEASQSDELESILKNSLSHLKSQLLVEDKYLYTLVYRELAASATALSQVTGQKYLLPPPENMVDHAPKTNLVLSSYKFTPRPSVPETRPVLRQVPQSKPTKGE